MPPALILPAERDQLRAEGILFAEHLRDAGNSAELHIMPQMHHGYLEDAANMEVYETTAPDVKATHDPSFREQAEEAVRMTERFLADHLH